jgi:hypothetical protein
MFSYWTRGAPAPAAAYPTKPARIIVGFAPVINIGEIPSLLAVHPALPVKNVRGLLQLAKARKGELYTPQARARPISPPKCSTVWPASRWRALPTRARGRR